MGTTFNAVGLAIVSDKSYSQLAEEVGEIGTRTTIYRRGAQLHGCCFKFGQGLEVWTIIHESAQGIFYADCRPAFRPEHIIKLTPWEMVEYDEEGQAVVRGHVPTNNTELVFELQNLTELNAALFHRPHLMVALAGLAYSAKGCVRKLPPRFVLTDKVSRRRRNCENDYTIRGQVLSLKHFQNPVTNCELIWAYVDTGSLKVELIVSANDVRGKIELMGIISATIWLQGYILNDEAVASRYEGVDRSFHPLNIWAALRRDN